MPRLDLYATPVFVFDVPDAEALNREVVAHLLEEERVRPGLQHSNYGGWHSEMDLMSRPDPCFRELTRLLLDHVGRVVETLSADARVATPPRLRMVHAWAMVMRAGDYTLMHDHVHADWSTAYYPDAGDGPGSGCLAFSDPRQGPRRPSAELDLFPALVSVPPRTSALVVFPGWLKHQVYAYEGTRPRVSISSNLVMEAAPALHSGSTL
jgi:uncharacterized protein (TIGR02466 family)